MFCRSESFGLGADGKSAGRGRGGTRGGACTNSVATPIAAAWVWTCWTQTTPDLLLLSLYLSTTRLLLTLLPEGKMNHT